MGAPGHASAHACVGAGASPMLGVPPTPPRHGSPDPIAPSSPGSGPRRGDPSPADPRPRRARAILTTPQTETAAPPFELGIVLAGAVSAGAYTSGVMDFLIQALQSWEDARARGE